MRSREQRGRIRRVWDGADLVHPGPSSSDLLMYAAYEMGATTQQAAQFATDYFDIFDEMASWGHRKNVLVRVAEDAYDLWKVRNP